MNQTFLAAAWEMVRQYQQLDLFGVQVHTPYAMNYIGLGIKKFIEESGHEATPELLQKFGTALAAGELGFGAYLAKGTPAELTSISQKLLVDDVPTTAKVTAEGIHELMQLYGLGVDCSGFTFNVLAYAWKTATGSEDSFLNQLNWKDPSRKDVRRAGTGTFSVGQPITDWNDVKPFDLFIISDTSGATTHIALLLPGDNGTWWLAQSSRSTAPMGVTVTEFTTSEGKPIFHMQLGAGTPWEVLNERGMLTRYRLTLP